MNEDLPIEAVVKNLLIERDNLKRENGQLRHELNNKCNAIKSFKKWQRESVKWNILQWIHEATKLEEPVLSIEVANKIKNIVKTGSSLISMRSKEISFAQSIKAFMEQDEIKKLLEQENE